MSKITVMAGDIRAGEWNVLTILGATSMAHAGDCIQLNYMIDNIEIVTEEKVKKFGGTVGMSILGGLALGPLGAIGGLLVGGTKKEICFVCQFKGGNKFLGKTDSKTY